MIKKLILGTLGGLAAGMVLSSIVFMGLMGNTVKTWMEQNAECLNEMNPVGWILGSLVMTIFVTILLIKFEVKTFRDGALTTTWITFFMVLWYGIFNASTFKAYGWDWLPLDLLGNMVVGAIAGGVVGWILGKIK
ncbi:MAG: hypothetical protein IPL46_22705 [Saprospiraceae bacterium]|nr:hypothetical protein [Saprospiraceae bacterium]